ncbi:hypothetical protein HDU87_008114 [Geranomyces variabilis]|uniref:Uncharacterized protein n=1 Tax=Geranomyces variabilis TaxID=109894 RepID=A0AAD5TPT4_9FUNG|nr:hypothetical protein HDU87_008114 [Geranomyces variabilis]
MGARQSKNEPIVIYNDPEVAINFSPDLVRKLQGQPPDSELVSRFGSFPTPPSFPPPRQRPSHNQQQQQQQQQQQHQQSTGYDSSSVDDVVRGRVARELALQTEIRLGNEQRSADAVAREAEDLIRRQKILPKTEPSPSAVAAVTAATNCYRKNQSRPLDCWREVEVMKLEAKKARRNFVAAH